ncbi:MAG: MerR family transcriptional regulator [Gammaproteobacteria bacterium]
MTQTSFTIGALAKKSGVSVETIRFYQRQGLLVEPDKPAKGVRRYTEHDVRRILFIKKGQALGFSLHEISELLSFEDGRHCKEVNEIALIKLVQIRERINALRTIEIALSDLADKCGKNNGSLLCPIIMALLERS